MDALIFSLNAILPIVAQIFLGWILQKINFLDQKFVSLGNKFNFRFGFMSLVFVNMYSIERFNKSCVDLATFAFFAVIATIALGFFCGAIFFRDRKQKGVIAQAIFRSNFAIIGVPLAASLFGAKGGASAAVIVAVAIPLFNIFSVIALTVFVGTKNSNSDFFENGKSQKVFFKNFLGEAKQIFFQILKNPLIDGVLGGALCLALRPHLNGWTLKSSNFSFIYFAIESLSKMATPLALVLLGASFKFSAVKRLWKKIFFAVFFRLILVPVLALLVAHFLFPKFSGAEYAALLSLFGCPVAVASAIMANQTGNDDELATQILVWSTIFSAFTLFAFIAFFRSKLIF